MRLESTIIPATCPWLRPTPSWPPATGHRSERNAVSFTLIYLVTHELDKGVVSNLKRLSSEARPDNPADLSSFPSSHTAQAFLTATLLHYQ